ncbi:MAG: hypothetical protein ACRDF9_05405 [Candidatus Limnocylindria bacterium]
MTSSDVARELPLEVFVMVAAVADDDPANATGGISELDLMKGLVDIAALAQIDGALSYSASRSRRSAMRTPPVGTHRCSGTLPATQYAQRPSWIKQIRPWSGRRRVVESHAAVVDEAFVEVVVPAEHAAPPKACVRPGAGGWRAGRGAATKTRHPTVSA